MARRNAQRGRYEPRISPVTTRPIAAPVDTYVRPTTTPGQQLARALAEIAPSVARFNDVLAADYIERQRERGAQAARIASEEALKAGDLTRMGKLPMQENPYFMAAYEEEWGKVAAGVWHSDFVRSMAEENAHLQESTSLEDFDRAVGKHIADFIQKHGVARSEAFERGFGAMKDAYLASQRLQFAQGIEKKLDAKSDEALFALTKRAITDNWNRQGITPDQIAADIEWLAQKHVLLGRQETKVRRAIAAAIRAAALEQEDPESGKVILGLLKMVKGEGGQGALVDQSYGAEVLDKTLNDLDAEAKQKLLWRRQEEERARKEKIDAVGKAAVAALLENPNINLRHWLQKNYEGFNEPEILGNLQALQNQAKGLAYTTNQYTLRSLFNRIWDPQQGESEVTVAEIISKSRNNQLTPQDTMWLINQLEQKNAAGAGKSPFDELAEALFKDQEKFFERYFQNTMGIAFGDRAERTRNSMAMLRSSWWHMQQSGQAAQMHPDDLNKWFVAEANRIARSQAGLLQFEFAPVPDPSIGPSPITPTDVVNGAIPPPPVQTKQEDPMTKPLPDGAVLTVEDILAHMSGDDTRIAKKMAELGYPQARFKEFVQQQLDLLEPQLGAQLQGQ